MWVRIQRFARAADDDGDGAAHAFAVGAAFAQEILAGFAGYGGEAHGKDVVTVEGDAEVGV